MILLESYGEQLKQPTAKFVPWKKIKAINFPPQALNKSTGFWTFDDVDQIEAQLPFIKFERIDCSKVEASDARSAQLASILFLK